MDALMKEQLFCDCMCIGRNWSGAQSKDLNTYILFLTQIPSFTEYSIKCTHGKNVNTRYICTVLFSCACLPTHLLNADLQVFFAAPVKQFHSGGKPLPLTFSHRGSYPFPPDHWHLSPPILTHSFILAMAVPDPCHHHNAANPFPWKYDWQVLRWMPISANCRSELGCHVPWDCAAVWLTSWAWCLREGMNATEQAGTNTYTHSMGSFSSTKRMGSLLRLSDLLWCIIYVSIVWPSLETCWQRHYSGFWQIPIHSQAFNNTC